MKLLATFAVAALTASIAAAEPKVTVGSFVLIAPNSRVAEICGSVSENGGDFTAVRIIVDPNSRRPGLYNVLAGKDGKFCAVVITYFGTAKASVEALGISSPVATVTSQNPRE